MRDCRLFTRASSGCDAACQPTSTFTGGDVNSALFFEDDAVLRADLRSDSASFLIDRPSTTDHAMFDELRVVTRLPSGETIEAGFWLRLSLMGGPESYSVVLKGSGIKAL
ncbi:hypothetical protein [Algihabitans albus]|uniref:hypothetical protein n=1 Tax=Algihabitans albus TaxID=2164067 RepID=UPI0013C366C7|nr:hypothetical protein [Algihabitans albus]